MQLFLKMFSGMADSVVPYQTSPLGLHCLRIWYFVRNFDGQNFTSFTVLRSTQSVCFHGEIRKISIFSG